jgi:AraC family transcriptional regulator
VLSNPVTRDDNSAGVFKRKAAWDGIRLEHCRLQRGDLPEHRHREHVVLIGLSDGCHGELRTESGRMLRGKQSRGAVYVLPAGLSHQASIQSSSEHLAIFLEPALVKRAAAEARLSSGFEILERYSRTDPIIHSIGMALLGELNSEGLSGRLYADSLANLLAVHLLRYYTTASAAPERFTGGLPGPTLKQVMNFIAENYASDITLSELARVAGMSSFHFAREFKRATGITPHQYVIRFRIERAKTLLAEGRVPLIEVGLRSGFSHQSHFTRLFRKLTGTTPNTYRLALRT